MTVSYYPASEDLLQFILSHRAIVPPQVRRLISRDQSEMVAWAEVERQQSSQERIVDAIMDYVLTHRELHAGLHSSGAHSPRGIAVSGGRRATDDTIKRLASSLDLTQQYVILYESFDEARQVANLVPKSKAVLEVEIGNDVQPEQIENMGRVFVVAEQIPVDYVCRVHASRYERVCQLLLEHNVDAEVVQLGAIMNKGPYVPQEPGIKLPPLQLRDGND